MLNKKVLSDNIKTLRLAVNMSQSELAEVLKISPQSVSKWERGNSLPDIEYLCIMSKIFGKSVDYIIGNEFESEEVMIGVDGGGSKTEFISFGSEGTIFRHIIKGATNPNTVGLEKSIDIINKGINEVAPPEHRVIGIYVGGSGFLTGNNGEKIREALMKKYPGIKIKCKSDILNVIATCTNEEKCIAVICGTGSCVFVKEESQLIKYGGWGPWLSKAGSGYDIGRDGIYFALRDKENMGRKTIISHYVEAKAGMPVEELIAEVYKNDQSYVASFASCVFRAYNEGDEVALDILNNNAKALSELINHASASHHIYENVILSGGILTNDEVFSSIMKKYLNKDIKVTVADKPQVCGACILAAKMCEKDNEKMRIKLLREYESGII